MNGTPKMLVAAITGSAAKVLWAFFFAKTALYVEDVQSWTGLKRETAYQALEQLRTYNLVEPTTGAHGKQQWHLGGETLHAILEAVPQLQESEKRTSGASRSTTTTDQDKNNPSSIVVVVGSQESEKRTPGMQGLTGPQLPEGCPEPCYESWDASFEKNWQAGRLAGIGEPKRTEIALMPHVTPQFIKDHVRSLWKGEVIGLAIRRIEGDENPRCWLEEIPTRAEIEERKRHLNPETIEEVEPED